MLPVSAWWCDHGGGTMVVGLAHRTYLGIVVLIVVHSLFIIYLLLTYTQTNLLPVKSK